MIISWAFGSMPGQNMDDPKAGEYYTARAVFYPAVGGYNVHNYFNLQQGYVYPSEDSDIYQKFGSAFRMTTCGSSAAQICPRPGATGTLYIYIDQVTENTVVIRQPGETIMERSRTSMEILRQVFPNLMEELLFINALFMRTEQRLLYISWMQFSTFWMLRERRQEALRRIRQREKAI